MTKKAPVVLFSTLLAFVVADVILLLVSDPYRNMLGIMRPGTRLSFSFRILPSLILASYYVFALRAVIRQQACEKLVAAHSLYCVLVGLAACVPWIGMFCGPLLPISSLYLGALLWANNGLVLASAIAMNFVILNGVLLWKSLRGFGRGRSAPLL